MEAGIKRANFMNVDEGGSWCLGFLLHGDGMHRGCLGGGVDVYVLAHSTKKNNPNMANCLFVHVTHVSARRTKGRDVWQSVMDASSQGVGRRVRERRRHVLGSVNYSSAVIVK